MAWDLMKDFVLPTQKALQKQSERRALRKQERERNMSEITRNIESHEARLNITWNGSNGDLPDPLPYDMDDNTIKSIASEAIQSGSVPGISSGLASFSDFVVDRFPATEGNPQNRLFLRPKCPFGT